MNGPTTSNKPTIRRRRCAPSGAPMVHGADRRALAEESRRDTVTGERLPLEPPGISRCRLHAARVRSITPEPVAWLDTSGLLSCHLLPYADRATSNQPHDCRADGPLLCLAGEGLDGCHLVVGDQTSMMAAAPGVDRRVDRGAEANGDWSERPRETSNLGGWIPDASTMPVGTIGASVAIDRWAAPV